MSKRLILFICIVLMSGTIAASTAYAETIILTEHACMAKMSEPDGNHDGTQLRVRTNWGDPTRAFKSWLKFDMSELDVSSLTKANLILALEHDRGPFQLDVSFVNDDCLDNIDWATDDLTWNNAPGNDPNSEGFLDPDKTTLITRFDNPTGVMGEAFAIDVLEALQSETDGIVQLVLHNSSSYLKVASPTHSQEAWRPYLTITEGAKPANGATDVPLNAVLSWLPGINAVTYDVYLGTNFSDVNEATRDNPLDILVSLDQEETTYDPPGLLESNQTYYWRVDEVNDANLNSPWKGDVWIFTVADFIVVEGFEDYNDYPPDEIWNTWIDGYDDPTNGSTAGYPNPNFTNGEHYVETRIVRSGKQSMPLVYDNSVGLSEVTRTLNADWTEGGVVTLTLFYHGVADNAPEQMFVAVDGVVVNNNDANAALVEEWTQWDIPLETLTGQGVNLSNVGSITLGFGNKAHPVAGGSGTVFFDDIRLYLPEPQ